MCATRHSIVDWVYSKTQTLLATLRTRNQPQEECSVPLEADHLFLSVGCARHRPQSHTVPQNLRLFLWMQVYAWMGSQLSIFGIWLSKCLSLPRTIKRIPKEEYRETCRVTLPSNKHTHNQTRTPFLHDIVELSNVVQIHTLLTPQTCMRNDLESDFMCTWTDRHPQTILLSKQHERAGHLFTLVFVHHGSGAAVLSSCGPGCCRVVSVVVYSGLGVETRGLFGKATEQMAQMFGQLQELSQQLVNQQ